MNVVLIVILAVAFTGGFVTARESIRRQETRHVEWKTEKLKVAFRDRSRRRKL